MTLAFVLINMLIYLYSLLQIKKLIQRANKVKGDGGQIFSSSINTRWLTVHFSTILLQVLSTTWFLVTELLRDQKISLIASYISFGSDLTQ